MKIEFDTAWNPHLDWLKKVSILFPELKFRLAYCESVMGFYGVETRSKSLREFCSMKYEFLYDDQVEIEQDVNEPNGCLLLTLVAKNQYVCGLLGPKNIWDLFLLIKRYQIIRLVDHGQK